MALTHSGWAVLVVLLVAATGPVTAADIAPVHGTPTAGADATLPATGTPFDDATNTTDDATNTTDDTTDDATNTTDTTEGATNTTEDATNTTNTTNPTDDTLDSADDTTNTTDETTETVNGTTETVPNTSNTTDETVEETANVASNTTGETVDDTMDAVDETTDTVDGTTADLESSTLAETGTGLSEGTLTDSSLTDTTSDTLDETEETTDDVEGVLPDDESGSLAVSSGSDSELLAIDAAASAESEDDADAGSGGDAGDDGDGGDVGEGDGSDGGDADTSVLVETENEQRGAVSRVLGAAWETLDGFIPEDAPVGPAGATGVGALALLAVASRQWFVHSTGSGTSTLLSSGLPGSTGDWVEKLKRLAVPLRYSRYDDSDPLEHDTRRTLHDAIEASPGINLTTLADRTDVPLSTARHHVRVLADENLVSTAKRHGKRRYYPAGADDVELADALSEPPKAAVLHALAHHGEAHVGLLADGLDRDPSTVTHHLQALADDGLVEREKRGRTVVNRLTGSARSTLGGDDRPTSDYAELSAND